MILFNHGEFNPPNGIMLQTNTKDSNKVLIVDDDEVLQRLLKEFFEQRGFIVFSVLKGEELPDFFSKQVVDVVVLDILLPGKSGFYWLEWLCKNKSGLPVLLLSSRNSFDSKINGLKLGAADYLVKPFHMTELLLRLQNILSHYKSTSINNDLSDESYAYCFDPEHALFFRDGKTIKLTTTEARLVQFLLENAGQIVTRDSISEALRGNSHHPLDRSIDVHVNRLRKKIEDKPSLPKYLNTVWGKGYRFVPPPKSDDN